MDQIFINNVNKIKETISDAHINTLKYLLMTSVKDCSFCAKLEAINYHYCLDIMLVYDSVFYKYTGKTIANPNFRYLVLVNSAEYENG